LKKTLIAFALVACYGATFAQTTCNGTGACSPPTNSTTVGDNRNGQIATGGSIANGANVQATGGNGYGGANIGGTANGGVVRTNVTTGAATTTSGAATTTGGNASIGNLTQGSIGALTQGSNGALTQGSIGALTGGNISSTGGNITSTAGAVTGGTNTTTNTSTNSNAGVNGSSTNTISVSTTSANDLAIAKEQAAAQVEAARIMSDVKVRNTPSIGIAGLSSSNDTCMGSTSAGGSGPGFSIGIGTTWTDGNCKMLKNSREMWNMGFRAAAVALLCTDAANKDALELTGYKCPQTERDEAARAAQSAAVQSNEPTDPLVRERMGLKPLGTK